MRLLIKQRVFSWSDTYDVYDEYGNTKYFVKGKVFSFGHQIYVYDARTNEEIGVIHQKLFTLMPRFEVEIRRSLHYFAQDMRLNIMVGV